MTANELRIGNWVNAGALLLPYDNGQVVEILADNVTINTNRGYYSYLLNDIQGIELSPEILEKAGFVADGFYNSAKRFKKENIILLQGNGKYILLHYPLTEYKNLHQLQNLYFVLTGTELEIKL